MGGYYYYENRNQQKNIARSMHTSSNDLWVRSMKHDTKTREEPYRCSRWDEEKHVRTLKRQIIFQTIT